MKVYAKPGFDWLFDRCAGIWSPVVSGNTGVTVLDLNPTTNYLGALSGMTAAEAWQQSDIGNVLAFDGVNDSVTIATDAVLTNYPFTLTSWSYHPVSIPNIAAALTLAVGISNTQYFGIGHRQAIPQPGVFARNTTFVANAVLSQTFVAQWICITGVFVSATRRELWVDGRLLATVATSVPQISALSSIRLGSGFAAAYHNQPIAEAMIHTRAWSPDQIAQYAAAGPGEAITLQPPSRRRSRFVPPTQTNNRRRTSRLVCYPG